MFILVLHIVTLWSCKP